MTNADNRLKDITFFTNKKQSFYHKIYCFRIYYFLTLLCVMLGSCNTDEVKENFEFNKVVDLLQRKIVLHRSEKAGVFIFDSASGINLFEEPSFVSNTKPELGGICFNREQITGYLPASFFTHSTIHVLMAPEDLLSDGSLEVSLALNQYQLGSVILRASPSWYTFPIPLALMKKLKIENNLLTFQIQKKTFKNVYFRLFQLQVSDRPGQRGAQFILKSRFSCDNCNRPAIIIAGSGVWTIPLGRGEHGELKCRITTFHGCRKPAYLTIRGLMDTGIIDIAKYSFNLVPDKEWRQISCIVPVGCRSIEMEVRGNLIIGNPELWVSHSREELTLPDILFVSIDTLRADHVGVYGDHVAITPYLDELGRKGAVVRRVYSQASVTNPSHASMFTGLYLHRHGVLGNRFRLAKSFHTLAEYFRKKGYRTVAAVGAMHMSAENSGFGQGFSAYFGTDKPKRDCMDVAGDLVETVTSNDTRPLFIFLHLFDPHIPYGNTPFGNYFDRDREVINEKIFPSDPQMTAKETQTLMALYHAEIADADRCVYWVEMILRRYRENRKHITVVVSDHGESLYEHNIFFQHHSGLYEKHVLVPLILYDSQGIWPSGIVPYRRELLDVFPTFLHRLSIKPRMVLPGKDIFSDVKCQNRDIYAEAGNMAVALWHNQMKIIKVLKEHPDFQKDMLFNLDDDPDELVNLCDRHEPIREYDKLARKVETWLVEEPEAKAHFFEQSPKLIQALETLGYIE